MQNLILANWLGKVELADILLAFGEIFTRPELLKPVGCAHELSYYE